MTDKHTPIEWLRFTEVERLHVENKGLRAENADLLAQANRTAGIYEKEIDMLRAENERLRINLRDYRAKHRCSHQVMCWADEIASKALDRHKNWRCELVSRSDDPLEHLIDE